MKPLTLNYAFFVTLICGWIESSRGAFFPSIQWTPDNPVIQNLNGKVRKVRNDDGLYIWCPRDYTQLVTTNIQVEPAKLYFALHKVETKQEYDDCDASNGKQMLVCDDPEDSGGADLNKKYKLLLFKERPYFNNKDMYKPGHTYYFIGTSGGREKNLHNKIGGKCASHNLKFAIYVCNKDEECNVEVLDGGWSTWKKNKETGICERNCTNPEPQNGGSPCEGPKEIDCSQVIIEDKKEHDKILPTVATMVSRTKSATKSTTETSTQPPTAVPTEVNATVIKVVAVNTAGITDRKTSTMLPTTLPNDKESTRKNSPEDKERSVDEGQKDDNKDEVTLTMKEAVLTFIGLFILGCMVGIVQVLAILHLRSKRLQGKQPEPVSPVNAV